LQGEILDFFHLEELPPYKSRKPIGREVTYFRELGVPNSALDVVHGEFVMFDPL